MKRVVLLSCLLVVLLVVPVFGVHAAVPLVVDQSELLSVTEVYALSELLEASADALGMDVVVLTVDSLDEKSAMRYADDYYDQNGYDYDGILLLVCMNEREYWISTSGSAISAFTDAELDRMGSRLVPDLQQGEYFDAFCLFADDVRTYGMSGGVETEPNLFATIAVCVGIGAGVGFLVVFVMKAQMKSVRREKTAGNYAVNGSFHLLTNSDIYLYRNVTRREKPQNNGSGSHRGSSGRSHGGRGGRF